jgi:hypothetical protein
MGPYSHYFLANRIISLVRPENEGEYYLGSVVPDIRYLAGMRRAQTHIDAQRILEYSVRYPHLKSFLQGYRVHCLIDEIDLQKVVGKFFPLNIINMLSNEKISQPQITMLVELYYLQTAPLGQPLSGSQNEMLAELGVESTHIDNFVSAMREYIQSPSYETGFSTFQRIGMINSSRVEKYKGAAHQLQKNALFRNFLMLAVKNANLTQLAVAHVSSFML